MTREEAAANLLQYLKENEKPGSVWAESLDMAIAALREQEGKDTNAPTKWVSVTERLPDEAVRVLVRLDGNKPPIGEPRMDTDRVVDGRWVRWFDLVTHWMYLPEAPKEEV